MNAADHSSRGPESPCIFGGIHTCTPDDIGGGLAAAVRWTSRANPTTDWLVLPDISAAAGSRPRRDAANVILAAVRLHFRLVLAWLRAFLRLILHALFQAVATPSPLKPAC